MKKGEVKIKDGFTLIEVSLVLGIAGLIFLMMMIALPALQRQERDTERREDITWLVDVIKKYQSNNRGALPGIEDSYEESTGDTKIVEVVWDENVLKDAKVGSWAGFYRDHLKESFKDPNGENYKLHIMKCKGDITDARCSDPAKGVASGLRGTEFPNEFTLNLIIQAKCAGNEDVGVVASSNSRKMAILYKMEGGGIYCADL